MYISSIIAYMCGIVSADHTNKFAHVHPLRTNPKFSHPPCYSLWKSCSVDSLDQDEWTRRIKESTWRGAHTNTRQSRPTACRRVSVRCRESCGRACVNRYATWRSMWVSNFDWDIFLIFLIFISTYIGEREYFGSYYQPKVLLSSSHAPAQLTLTFQCSNIFACHTCTYIRDFWKAIHKEWKFFGFDCMLLAWIEKLRRASAAEGHEWKWGWKNSCFNSSQLNFLAEKFFSYFEKSQSDCQIKININFSQFLSFHAPACLPWL